MEKKVSPRPISDKFLLLLLFGALLFVCLVLPFVRDRNPERPVLLNLGVTVILILGSIGSLRSRIWILFGIPALGVTLSFVWTGLLVETNWLFVTNCILQAACFVVMACLLLYRVFAEHLASWTSMIGAICGYLLIGLCWTMLYGAVLQVDPQAFQFENHVEVQIGSAGATETAFSQLIYLSFVTMSTLGYGDILPRVPLAMTLTWTQSVIGQFYLAILVAHLVGVLPNARGRTGDASVESSG